MVDSRACSADRGRRQPAAKADAKKLGGFAPPYREVDSLGLLLAVLVTKADVADAVAARQVLVPLTYQRFPRLRLVRRTKVADSRAMACRPGWRRLGHFLLDVGEAAAGGRRFVAFAAALGGGADFVRLRWLPLPAAHSRDDERLDRVERGHDPDQYDLIAWPDGLNPDRNRSDSTTDSDEGKRQS